MATEFHLPELGENIEAADIVEVMVSVGDTIAIDDSILEVETDKATLEVPSSVAGVITELNVAAGDSVSVGQIVMTVDEVATDSAPAATPDAEKPQEAEAPPAAQPSPEAPPSETRTATAPSVAVETVPTQTIAAQAPPTNGTSSGPRKLTPAAPSTRRLAREIGVVIEQVRGTGPNGRISQDDVKAHAKRMLSSASSHSPAAASAGPAVAAAPLPDFSNFGSVRRESMSKIRKVTAQQMHRAWSTIPQVTQFDKADITDLEALRKKLNKENPDLPKLTVTALLIKILATALKKFPQFNASIDMTSLEIVYKDYFHIGVAVDTDRGLLVPVVKDADGKGTRALAADLNELAKKARDRKIRPDDLQGSCMTITNLGGIGGNAFTPIVNPPEVAILGVSRASMEPVYHEGTFYARLLMPLCVTYDHRLIDGADAARFLRWICETLENPATLAFES